MEQVNAKEYNKNPTLSQLVTPDNDLKNILLEYVGEKLGPANQNITTEMIVEIMAEEFPDFLLVVAEENFLRGYEQALSDVDSGQKEFRMEQKKNDKQRKSCKLCEE
tara:strand:+ start:10604 stop:10924 length:321 start_codon:yes stop_codon:yes gene_type:complete